MERVKSSDFRIIFDKLECDKSQKDSSGESEGLIDAQEMEEIRRLREIVSQTLEPPRVYFSRS
jgi:hypothetical protein